MVLGANLLRNQDLGAKGEAHANAEKHIEKLATDPHRRKAGGADELTHDHHVHHAVDCLKGVGQGHGNRKDCQLF